jgi:hypothetical protein
MSFSFLSDRITYQFTLCTNDPKSAPSTAMFNLARQCVELRVNSLAPAICLSPRAIVRHAARVQGVAEQLGPGFVV